MDHETRSGDGSRHLGRKLAIGLALACSALSVGSISSASACVGARTPAYSLSVDQARQAVTCLINHRRANHHVRRLNGNVALGVAAQSHSDSMNAGNYFSHEGDGTPESRAASSGYMAGARSWGVGEDLAWGDGSLSTPRAAVRGWMGSPEHRTILLSGSWIQIGIGVAQGAPAAMDDRYAGTYTALFGFRHQH